MNVEIVGMTVVRALPESVEGTRFAERMPLGGQGLIEMAGRLCYQSWHLPNPETAKNGPYISNIIAQQHYSILEHVSVSFHAEGVSRNLSHELIRHRHLSFSELSQRFVDMSHAQQVTPPALGGGMADVDTAGYKKEVEELLSTGLTRKQAREAARYSLPAGLETKFIVTGNLRAWRDMLSKRMSPHADAEMQRFAKAVFDLLYEEYPDVFKDMKEDRNA